MYGVNNRTLWLEYRKRGYPINRPSIKNRNKTDFVNEGQQVDQNQISAESQEENHQIITQPMDMVTAAFSNVYTEDMRARYHDTAILTAQQMNIHGINFS